MSRVRAFLPAGVTLVVVAASAVAASRISIDHDITTYIFWIGIAVAGTLVSSVLF